MTMISNFRPLSNKKGYTLIELLVVVAVIAALMAIIIPQYKSYRESAFISVLETDAHTLAAAQEAYFADHGTYANTAAAVQTDIYGATNLSSDTTIGGWAGDTISFSFTVTDNTHGGLVVTYISNAGGIQ